MPKIDNIDGERKLKEVLALLQQEALLVRKGLSIFKLADDQAKHKVGQGKG